MVRLVLAISLDGRLAFPAGGETHLGRQGDRKVLEEALAWADATLMGSKTLRAHQNTCLIHSNELITRRLNQGRTAQPISIVISTKKPFSNHWSFFHQPIKRWLITNEKPFMHNGYEKVIPLQDKWSETISRLSH